MNEGIYLDYNASTPVDPAVLDAMLPYLSTGANASSPHAAGRQVRAAVETARAQVAQLIGADAEDMVFTSGATEANNLALVGASPKAAAIDATAHKAMLSPLPDAVRLVCRADGRIDLSALDALRPRPDLVALGLANNETGVVQPVVEIGAWCAARDATFHVDATQGLGHVAFDVKRDQVTSCALSAHKLYGPTGVGALYLPRRFRRRYTPLLRGGGQEDGLRPGTLNAAAIIGFGAAAQLLVEGGSAEAARLERQRSALWAGLSAAIPEVAQNASGAPRLPGTLNVYVLHAAARRVLAHVDGKLHLAAGSACTQASLEPSHVLRAMGIGNDRAQCSLRLSVGRPTRDADLPNVISVLAEAVAAVRADNPMWAIHVARQTPSAS